MQSLSIHQVKRVAQVAVLSGILVLSSATSAGFAEKMAKPDAMPHAKTNMPNMPDMANMTPEQLAKMCPVMKPTEEHLWLQKLVGDWKTEAKAYMMPGQEPMTSEATVTNESLGKFWLVSKYDGEMMNQPFQGIQTIGYDEKKGKVVATWTDSMTGHLWNYEGELDKATNTLTLHTEGYCPMYPDKLTKMKDVIELKDDNHSVYTSYMQDEHGEWVKKMEATSVRVAE